MDLWTAATEGDLRLVQEICQNPAVNLNWQDHEQNRTPLFRACGHGWPEVVKFLLGMPRLLVNLPQIQDATPLFIACAEGHVTVILLLLADERIEVNKARDSGATPFLVACEQGHAHVVSLLQADPRVDVTQPKHDDVTPFYSACENGQVDVVLLLLADERVDILQPMNDETSPLWAASSQGHLSVVQHLLARGRGEIDTKKISTFNSTTASAQARLLASRTLKESWESEEQFQRVKDRGPKIADLIDEFEENPGLVRRRLRKQLGIDDSLAGELFALVVYFCDGYLTIPSGDSPKSENKTKVLHDDLQRFFTLASRLPMDLQMVLCNRVFGLAESIVKSVHSERGFKKFAKGF